MKRMPLGYKNVKCFIDQEVISSSPLQIKHIFSIPTDIGEIPNFMGFEVDLRRPIKITFNYAGDNNFLCSAIFEIWRSDSGGVCIVKSTNTKYGTNSDFLTPSNLDITLNYRDNPVSIPKNDLYFDYTDSKYFNNPTNIIAVVPLGEKEPGFSYIIEE